MADLPYYRRFPKDYLSDEHVALMTLEQEGAYNRLMDYCWLQGSIPDDVESLARLCRVSAEKMRELWPGIEPCFERGDGGRLVHPALHEEREKVEEKRRKLSEAGRRGARKRWGSERPTDAGDDARSSDGDPNTQANADPSGEASGEANGGAIGEGSGVDSGEGMAFSEGRRQNQKADTTASSSTARESDELPEPDPPDDSPFADLFPDSPAAVEALESLEHRGGRRATVATLRTSFVYEDEAQAMPDPSVKGRSPPERRELVTRALLQMADQGVQEWGATRLAGFIRRLENGNGGRGTSGPGREGGEEASGGSGPKIRGERRRQHA